MYILRHFGSCVPYSNSLDTLKKIITHDNIGVIQLYRTNPKELNKKYKYKLHDLETFSPNNKFSVYIHSSYPAIISSANMYKNISLIADIKYANAFTKAERVGIVVHPGKYTIDSYKNIIKTIKIIIKSTNKESRCNILLENMAKTKKNNPVISTIENIIKLNKYLVNKLSKDEYKRIGFCIDTCHYYVTCITLNLPVNFIDMFYILTKNKIPIKLIHLNDSLSDTADKHSDLFRGYIPPIELIRLIKYIYNMNIDSVIERMPHTCDTNEIAYNLYKKIYHICLI